MKWLLIAAMVGGVMFTATGNDFLNDYPEQDYSITGNHKVVEVECGDFFDPPTLTAWDACDGEITEDIITGGDFVLTDLVGEYVITYNVFDSAENPSEEATRTVQVIDTSPPLITLFGENPALAALGEAYTDSGANAFDACDGDLTARMLLDNTVDITVIGQYTITYNVEDAAGNAASEAIRRVHVSDDMPDAGPLSDIVLLEGMYYEWDGNVENESDVNGFQWYRHNGRYFEPVRNGSFSHGAFSGAGTSVLHFSPFTDAMAGEYLLEVSDNKTAVQRTATVSCEKDTGVPVGSTLGIVLIAFATAVTGAAALKKKDR